jgi:hypothetical protein
MMLPVTATTADLIWKKAAELARPGNGSDPEAAVKELIEAAGHDRSALEEAQRHYAIRLHNRSDDWEATAALTLLNRALARVGWDDEFDWKKRWAQHRKP